MFLLLFIGRTSIIIAGIIAGSPNGEFAIDFFNNDSTRVIFRLNPRFETKTVVRTAQRSDFM